MWPDEIRTLIARQVDCPLILHLQTATVAHTQQHQSTAGCIPSRIVAFSQPSEAPRSVLSSSAVKFSVSCFDCRFCLARRTTDFCGFLKSGPKFGSADHFRFRSPPERCRHSLNLGSDVCRSPCLREGFSECRGVCSLQASDNRASAKVINHCLAGSFVIGEMPIRDLTSFPAIVHCGQKQMSMSAIITEFDTLPRIPHALDVVDFVQVTLERRLGINPFPETPGLSFDFFCPLAVRVCKKRKLFVRFGRFGCRCGSHPNCLSGYRGGYRN